MRSDLLTAHNDETRLTEVNALDIINTHMQRNLTQNNNGCCDNKEPVFAHLSTLFAIPAVATFFYIGEMSDKYLPSSNKAGLKQLFDGLKFYCIGSMLSGNYFSAKFTIFETLKMIDNINNPVNKAAGITYKKLLLEMGISLFIAGSISVTNYILADSNPDATNTQKMINLVSNLFNTFPMFYGALGLTQILSQRLPTLGCNQRDKDLLAIKLKLVEKLKATQLNNELMSQLATAYTTHSDNGNAPNLFEILLAKHGATAADNNESKASENKMFELFALGLATIADSGYALSSYYGLKDVNQPAAFLAASATLFGLLGLCALTTLQTRKVAHDIWNKSKLGTVLGFMMFAFSGASALGANDSAYTQLCNGGPLNTTATGNMTSLNTTDSTNCEILGTTMGWIGWAGASLITSIMAIDALFKFAEEMKRTFCGRKANTQSYMRYNSNIGDFEEYSTVDPRTTTVAMPNITTPDRQIEEVTKNLTLFIQTVEKMSLETLAGWINEGVISKAALENLGLDEQVYSQFIPQGSLETAVVDSAVVDNGYGATEDGDQRKPSSSANHPQRSLFNSVPRRPSQQPEGIGQQMLAKPVPSFAGSNQQE